MRTLMQARLTAPPETRPTNSKTQTVVVASSTDVAQTNTLYSTLIVQRTLHRIATHSKTCLWPLTRRAGGCPLAQIPTITRLERHAALVEIAAKLVCRVAEWQTGPASVAQISRCHARVPMTATLSKRTHYAVALSIHTARVSAVLTKHPRDNRFSSGPPDMCSCVEPVSV